jgi:hypothetical protein
MALRKPVAYLGRPNYLTKKEDLLPVVYAFHSLITPTVMSEIAIFRPIACQVIQYLSMDDSSP